MATGAERGVDQDGGGTGAQRGLQKVDHLLNHHRNVAVVGTPGRGLFSHPAPPSVLPIQRGPGPDTHLALGKYARVAPGRGLTASALPAS